MKLLSTALAATLAFGAVGASAQSIVGGLPAVAGGLQPAQPVVPKAVNPRAIAVDDKGTPDPGDDNVFMTYRVNQAGVPVDIAVDLGPALAALCGTTPDRIYDQPVDTDKVVNVSLQGADRRTIRAGNKTTKWVGCPISTTGFNAEQNEALALMQAFVVSGTHPDPHGCHFNHADQAGLLEVMGKPPTIFAEQTLEGMIGGADFKYLVDGGLRPSYNQMQAWVFATGKTGPHCPAFLVAWVDGNDTPDTADDLIRIHHTHKSGRAASAARSTAERASRTPPTDPWEYN